MSDAEISMSGGFLEEVRTLDLQGVEDAARAVAPGLFPSTVAPLGEGMDHRAFLVGPDHVFRFPKHRLAARLMEVELRVLPRLAPRLNLPIPRYQFAGRLATEVPFVGYRMIHGEPLTAELVASLPEGERADLGRDFGGFLGALHAFPVEEARALGVREYDPRPDRRREWDRARSEAYPLVGEATREFVEREFAAYLGDEGNFAFEPALLHSDLGPDHVLYDRARGRLAGVIDFDLGVGDPDLDLSFYRPWAGFHEGVLPHLPPLDESRLRRKVRFFEAREAVVDLLWALEHGDGPSIEEQRSLLEGKAHG